MRLSNIQKAFTDLVFSDVNGVENPPEEFAALFDLGNLDITHRLEIYSNHVIGTLSGVIGQTFPLVQALVGEEFLMRAAKHFVMETPPKEACLDRYGKTFPDFLKSYKPAQKLAYLSDTARLDWAINEAECAKDDAPFNPEIFAGIAEENLPQLYFTFRDCVRFIESDYALDKIYDLCQKEDGDQEGVHEIDQPSFMLITRQDFEAKILRLDECEFLLLKLLSQGQALGAALEEILGKYPAFNFAEFLQNYLAFGIFKSIEIKT